MSIEIGSGTPETVDFRLSAKALIGRANRVLLVQERHDDGSEFWTLPGGGLQRNEGFVEALSRELFEELRCRVSVGKRLTEHWYAHASSQDDVSLLRVYRCELQSPVVPAPEEGIFDYQWVRPDDLPPETLLPVRYTLENALPRTALVVEE